MSILILLVFSALFTSGQTSWRDLARLAKQHQEADDLPGAESLRWRALRLAEKELGPGDKQLAPLLGDLAFSLHFAARDAEAEPLMQRAFGIAKESGDLRLTGMMLNILGIVLAGEGQRARAEPALRRSVALLEEAEGPDSLDAAKAANNLATVYLDEHQYERAEEEMARALPVYEKRLGAEHPEVAQASGNMFTVLAAEHRMAEGEPYLRRALAIGEKVFPGSLRMANLQLCLASLEESRENFKAAARLLEQAIATQERVLGPEHPELARTLSVYADVLRHMHQKAEAKVAMNRANSIRKAALSDVK
jgi:tetratricopeptide (TPR) repeat protein